MRDYFELTKEKTELYQSGFMVAGVGLEPHDLRVMRGIEKLRVIFRCLIRRFWAVSGGLVRF